MRLALPCLLALPSLAGRAVPAKPGVLSYPMPDGSFLNITLSGDENAHVYTTPEGFTLLPAPDGALHYAVADASGILRCSDVTAHNADARTDEERTLLAGLDKELIARLAVDMASQSATRTARQRIPAQMVTTFPTTGSPKALVLLIEFQDIKFTTPDAHMAFSDLVNKPGYDHNGATGSAFDYFRENSMGVYTPDFEVFGPVTVPETEAYYGKSTAQLYDVQGFMMAYDGIVEMMKMYPDTDFSEFDTDGDGVIDNVFIFYAGYGQNEGAPEWTIWPHAAQLYSMYGLDLRYKDVRFDKFACTNELRDTSGDTRTGIGTFVHEFSHVLGLMDIYPTMGGDRNASPGNWCVMDHGSYNNQGNTPPCFNTFERYSLGWTNPRKLTGPENVVLHNLQDSNQGLLIQTEKDEEFFLLENRQAKGWDKYTGGHGMLIWHIDYDGQVWKDNHINNVASHQRVDLIEADNLCGDTSRNGDPFPGTGGVHEFTSTSNPAMKTWIGVDPGMPLTDIYEVDGVITFRVKGGGDALPVPAVAAATDVTPVSFVANWTLAPSINEYELDVCKGSSVVPFATYTVKGTTSKQVEGLTPDTDYTYVVRSLDEGRASADSQRMSVTTLSPTFDMRAPVAQEATQITHEGFTACWEPMEDAAGYKLDVYTKTPVDPMRESVDFTDGVSLPDGWITNCSTTGSLNGYFGESAPALRMMYDGDRLTTPVYEGGVNSFSFWYRGNSTDDEASLSLEGMLDGEWVEIHTLSPLQKQAGATVSFGGEDGMAIIPEGVKQLRLIFHKGNKGSLYLDDVVLLHDASYTRGTVGEYTAYDCGYTHSLPVSGLERGSQYYYTVRAYDAQGIHSKPSQEITLITAKESGMGGVTTRGGVAVSGTVVTVTAPAAGDVVLYSLDGRILTSAYALPDVPCSLTLPGRGIYLLQTPGACFKLVY